MWSAKPGCGVVVHFVCQCVTEAGLALIDMHAIPKPSKNMQPLFTQQQPPPPPKNSLSFAILKPSYIQKKSFSTCFSSYKECVSCLSYICKKRPHQSVRISSKTIHFLESYFKYKRKKAYHRIFCTSVLNYACLQYITWHKQKRQQ